MKSIKDVFLQYEKIGFFSRINEDVWPTAFKCATVSTDELHLLRKVKNIVRRGRIESLEHDKIIFKDKRFANHSTNFYRLFIFILSSLELTKILILGEVNTFKNRVFIKCQIWIVNYYVRKFIRKSQ